MVGSTRIPVSFAVEGDTDEAVVGRLAAHVGVDVHRIHGRRGKAWIMKRLNGLNDSAKGQPWCVLMDLNGDAPCAGEFVRTHLPRPAPLMRLRIAVRTVEAWFLADHSTFARFLGVQTSLLPRVPDAEPDPKARVIDLARRSRIRRIHSGLPPRPGSGRQIGELYTSLLIEFVNDRWNMEAARARSPSLDRALTRLAELMC